MEMGFVCHFGQAMPVCVGARSKESVKSRLLGDMLYDPSQHPKICCDLHPNHIVITRFGVLVMSSHNREDGGLGTHLYCGLPAKGHFPPVRDHAHARFSRNAEIGNFEVKPFCSWAALIQKWIGKTAWKTIATDSNISFSVMMSAHTRASGRFKGWSSVTIIIVDLPTSKHVLHD